MRWILLLTLFVSFPAAASPLWGKLTPGKHAVGFRELERVDHARRWKGAVALDGKPRSGERGRPMRILVWYPAVATADARPMTFGDYLARMGAETHLGPVGPADLEAGRRLLHAFPLVASLTPAQREKLESFPSRAVIDAPVARGKFPLVVYSLGSGVVAHVTAEHLASHGYVVMQLPRLGSYAGFPGDAPTIGELDHKLRDMDFLINAAAALPEADVTRIAAIGFSAGGRWALSLAMRNPEVRAVVSLDTAMLWDDPFSRQWRQLPWYDVGEARAPILHLIRKDWVAREAAAEWPRLVHADRWYLRFDEPRLDHWDFQSLGYALTLTGARADAAAEVARTFELFHRYTLAFLEAHVRGDQAARKWLARTPEQNGAARGTVTQTFTPARPAARRPMDFLNTFDEGDVDATLVAFRREHDRRGAAPVPENVLNTLGYVLVASGRAADAVRVFATNVEAHPKSANAHDSLADGYLAAGDAARARESARKAIELLASDPSPPERKQLIRESAEQKLK